MKVYFRGITLNGVMKTMPGSVLMQQWVYLSQDEAEKTKAQPHSHQDRSAGVTAARMILCCCILLILVIGIQATTPRQAQADSGPDTLDFVTDPSERGDIDADGYHWNGADTLTLSGLNLAVVDQDGIILPGGSSVVVANSSSLSVTTNDKDTSGILVESGNLTIAGEGKLTIAATSNEGIKDKNASGIVVADGVLNLSGCTIDSKGTDSALFGYRGIEIDSSTIAAEAKIEAGGCWAIYVYEGDINVRSSVVDATVSGGIASGKMDEHYCLLTASGNINIADSAVSFDATDSNVEGNGIGSFLGNISVEGGSVQGKTNGFGNGMLVQIEDPDSPYGRVAITNGAHINLEGFCGISGPLGIEIVGSNVHSISQGNALIAGSGPLTIDSSTVFAHQIWGRESVAVHSSGDMTITNSFVEVYANEDDECRGMLVSGDGAGLVVENNSTVIVEGSEAAIIIWHDDEAPVNDSYIRLGAGQRVLEGGQVAYVHTPELESAGSSYWSYSLGGSISVANGFLQSASKRVVIDHGKSPVDPVIPKTGDALPLTGLYTCLLLGTVCLLLANRAQRMKAR